MDRQECNIRRMVTVAKLACDHDVGNKSDIRRIFLPLKFPFELAFVHIYIYIDRENLFLNFGLKFNLVKFE